MDDFCKTGQLPVVRLALAKAACPRFSRTKVNTVERIVSYVQQEYGCMPQEYCVAVALDSAMHPLAIIEVSVGAMAFAQVDPKVLFSALLLAGATAFILLHNHPSGDAEPSQADADLTRQLSTGAKILTLALVDHIVVAAEDRVSFRERGMLPR